MFAANTMTPYSPASGDARSTGWQAEGSEQLSTFGIWRPRSTVWLSRAIRSVATRNQWSRPMKSFFSRPISPVRSFGFLQQLRRSPDWVRKRIEALIVSPKLRLLVKSKLDLLQDRIQIRQVWGDTRNSIRAEPNLVFAVTVVAANADAVVIAWSMLTDRDCSLFDTHISCCFVVVVVVLLQCIKDPYSWRTE